MGAEEMERIKKILADLGLHPEYLEHKAVITSQEAAETRGFSLKQGVKALLFTNRADSWVIVNVPADMRVDQKKVAEKLGWSKGKTRMATEDEVMGKTGCQIGAVPPFGHKENIPIFFDPEIFENEMNSFNIGLRTNSVRIKSKELKVVFEKLDAVEGEFIR